MFEQWKEHSLISSNQWKPAIISVEDMARVSPPGPEHQKLTRWARSQGVKINGVGPAKISGSGLGIVAQRRIEAREELVYVPASALLTVNSIPKRFRALHEGITVHGLLASFLASNGSKKSYYGPWAATWPSLTEFKESMPLLWSGKLSQMLSPDGKSSATHGYHEALPFGLPPAIGGRWQLVPSLSRVSEDVGLLNQQARKFAADWDIVSRIFPDKVWEDYAYYWLVVNTRSFYFELPDAKNTPQADRMVMCPFIDYFNHNDHGCDVIFDQSGYTVISDRAYDVGQELQTSYGSHSNDVLLCEYGFILQSNRFDYVPLDDLFGGHMMSSKDTENLEAAGYLGNYTLTSEGVCFRTQVAIRSVTLNTQDWKKFMAGTFDEPELSKSQAAAVLQREFLQLYEKEAEEALQHLAKEKVHEILTRAEKMEAALKIPQYATEVLLRRWKQILDLIHQAMEIHDTPYYHGLDPP